MSTHRVSGHVELLSQFTASRVGHERAVRRRIERNHPTLASVFLCRHGRSFASRLGQPVKVVFIGQVQLKRLVLLQYILRELQRQQAGLLCKLSQLGFPVLVKQRAAAHKSVVAVVEQPLFLRRQFAVMLIHLFRAFKKLPVQRNVVGMFREQGAHLLSQLVQLVVGLCAEQA